jgi:hypothetical protein
MWLADPSRKDKKDPKKTYNPRQSRDPLPESVRQVPNLCMERIGKSQSLCRIIYSGRMVEEEYELARLNAR